LSLNSIPLKQEVFHRFEKSSKDRAVICDTFDATNLLPFDADLILEQLAGMEKVKAKIKGLTSTHVDLYRQAVKALLSVVKDKKAFFQDTPLRRNIVLQGPSGVGKTITAQAIAIYLAANDLVANKKFVVYRELGLRGEYLRETNIVIDKLLEFAKGGVLILDELDAIASINRSSSFDSEARNHLNACMESANKAGTIVIATGYPKGIESLFSDQPGFRERFPAVWDIEKYDDHQICKVFDKKLELEGLRIEPVAQDLAYRELLASSERLGDKFGNARTIERFVNMIVDANSHQFTDAYLRQIIAGRPVPVDILTVSMASIPQFDSRHNEFVKGGARLRMITTTPDSAPGQR